MEEVVERFNESFASESRQGENPALVELDGARGSNSLDIAVLKEAVAPAARRHTAFLVDVARAEALDAMGENQAAVAVMERHM